jgi:hypothetical protein
MDVIRYLTVLLLKVQRLPLSATLVRQLSSRSTLRRSFDHIWREKWVVVREAVLRPRRPMWHAGRSRELS